MEAPLYAHVINPETMAEDVTRAGFAIVSRDDRFVKNPDGYYYSRVVAERRPGAADAEAKATAGRSFTLENVSASSASMALQAAP